MEPVRHDLYEAPGLAITYICQPGHPGPRRLVFTFTERGNAVLSGDGFAGAFLLERGYDVVAIKSSRFSWYEELAPAIPGINAAIAASGRHYAARICYGSSMGGHGAMRYSGTLGASRVIAISPLFDIRDPGDTRYAEDIPNLQSGDMITRSSLSDACDYFLLFDPHTPDAAHAARFAGLLPPARITLLKFPYSGHPTSYFLAETGILKPVMACLIGGGRPEDLRDLTIDRQSSPSYLYSLAETCHRRKKFRWAHRLIARAAALQEGNPEIQVLMSVILTALRDWAGAEAAARRAVTLDPANFHRNLALVDVLMAQEDCIRALAVMDRLVGLAPEIGHYAWLRDEIAATTESAESTRGFFRAQLDKG